MNAAQKHQPESAAGWLKAIKRIDWQGDEGLARLKEGSLRFLAGDWLDLALVHGWDEAELWGCFPGTVETARRRYDCQGLVVALLLGRGSKLISIDHACAVVERDAVKHKAVLRHPRELPGRAYALPWWQAISVENGEKA